MKHSEAHPNLADFLQATLPGHARPVCRLGLASRGNTSLGATDVHTALERGVNFLNWCGIADGLSEAVADLGQRRAEVVVCVQFEARAARDARQELPRILRQLRTDYVDILTFYYVEQREEWEEIASAEGSLAFCRAAQRDGVVRLLGLTSHQRRLAAEIARSRALDLLMIRYNAAHRGAEADVFPTTTALNLPVIAFTCLRWGALLAGTPADPLGFVVPRAPDWYRFVLQTPAVTVALAAPNDGTELREDLSVLDVADPLTEQEYERLAQHGQRVRQFAGSFP